MEYGYFDFRPMMFSRKVDNFLAIQKEIEQSARTGKVQHSVTPLKYENITRMDILTMFETLINASG